MVPWHQQFWLKIDVTKTFVICFVVNSFLVEQIVTKLLLNMLNVYFRDHAFILHTAKSWWTSCGHKLCHVPSLYQPWCLGTMNSCYTPSVNTLDQLEPVRWHTGENVSTTVMDSNITELESVLCLTLAIVLVYNKIISLSVQSIYKRIFDKNKDIYKSYM